MNRSTDHAHAEGGILDSPKMNNVDLSAEGLIVAFSDGKIYLFDNATMASIRQEMGKFIAEDTRPIGGAD
jgi:hypothetical protein